MEKYGNIFLAILPAEVNLNANPSPTPPVVDFSLPALKKIAWNAAQYFTSEFYCEYKLGVLVKGQCTPTTLPQSTANGYTLPSGQTVYQVGTDDGMYTNIDITFNKFRMINGNTDDTVQLAVYTSMNRGLMVYPFSTITEPQSGNKFDPFTI